MGAGRLEKYLSKAVRTGMIAVFRAKTRRNGVPKAMWGAECMVKGWFACKAGVCI